MAMWTSEKHPGDHDRVIGSTSTGGVHVEQSGPGSILRFGAFEVDLRTSELRKNGLKIRLQDQPFQVLSLLITHAGDIVTRDDVRVSVWPGDTFVDFDHALNTAVKKIRAALGDDADNPRFVETVPRRGYRFIAHVETNGIPSSSEPLARSAFAQSYLHRTLLLVGAAAAVLAVLGLAWRAVPRNRSAASTAPDFQRLTFDLAELGEARFTPDGATVVYSAGSAPHRNDLYTLRLGAPGAQSAGIANAMLQAVSAEGELAILRGSLNASNALEYEKPAETLARVSLGGGAPRDLLPDVEAADWSPDGQLAVVRRAKGRSRLEFPVGKVLYENTGWIASPRFSPRGDMIAFLDHPVTPDDRGNVAVVDLKGRKRILSGFWESERGLAWSPNAVEVWFAATRSGVSRALYAVTLGGQERRVLSVAGGLTLQDISRDGGVLLTRDNERLGILFMGPGDKEPRDLSWHDWSMAEDISADGKNVLFGEEGENSGPSYQVGLRPVDGSPPVILGPGVAESLSPDGNWALSIMPPPSDQIVLLPTGAGTQKVLERGPIERYQFSRARWFPDGKQILFVGSEPGHGSRCYMQGVDGGPPRALTPEGIVCCTVSPGGHVLAETQDFRGLLYESTSSSKPERELKFEPGEAPVEWTADGKMLYLLDLQRRPSAITRLEIASGRRQIWRELTLPGSITQMKGEEAAITPDGRSYAYTYSRHLSDLYLVRGLK